MRHRAADRELLGAAAAAMNRFSTDGSFMDDELASSAPQLGPQGRPDAEDELMLPVEEERQTRRQEVG